MRLAGADERVPAPQLLEHGRARHGRRQRHPHRDTHLRRAARRRQRLQHHILAILQRAVDGAQAQPQPDLLHQPVSLGVTGETVSKSVACGGLITLNKGLIRSPQDKFPTQLPPDFVLMGPN